MRILTLGLMAVPLAACATTPAPDTPADQPPPMAGACNADAAQSHVGSTVSAAIGAPVPCKAGSSTQEGDQTMKVAALTMISRKRVQRDGSH